MSEKEIEMAMSNEDLIMIVIGLVVFILSFSDVSTGYSIAFASFPAIVVFLIGWILVRFRKRPLPKQIHQTRLIYLAHIKSLRNYNLISIIIFNILFLSRYLSAEDEARTIMVFNFIALFVMSALEFAGHLTVTDSIQILPKLENESDEEYKKKKFELLFGTRYWVWLGVTVAIAIAAHYFPFAEAIILGDVLIIVFQVLSILGGVGLFLFLYYRTSRYQRIVDPAMAVKAAEYYDESDLKDVSIKYLENYIQEYEENVAIMSKLAVLYLQENEHGKVLETAQKILAETEEKSINVPHMISKAHLLKAISLKAMEEYQEAYKEVSASLRYIPENAAARKLRRDLRKVLKMQQTEKKE